MNWRRVAFWLGVFALVDVLLLLSPVPVPAALQVVPAAVVPLLALVAAGYGVKLLATAAGEPPNRTPPVTARDDDAAVARVGGDIDGAFDALDADGSTAWSTMNARRVLRTELRRSAVTALEARGHTREEAERLVDAGAWTDDRRAAAFLGKTHLPLRIRIRDWASGDGARRQAEAAVEELAAMTASPDASDRLPERRDHRPAGDLLGDMLEGGDAATVERTAELEPEVDA
jgi:hypothetical protein